MGEEPETICVEHGFNAIWWIEGYNHYQDFVHFREHKNLFVPEIENEEESA